MQQRISAIFAIGLFATVGAAPSTYTAHVYLLNFCQSSAAPAVSISEQLRGGAKRSAAMLASPKAVPDGWSYNLLLPRNHIYLWFDTRDCEAKISVMSADGSARSYAAALGRGAAVALDEADVYIWGRLPFVGVESVALVDPDSYGVLEEGEVVGDMYYFPAGGRGKVLLRVQAWQSGPFAYFPMTIPFQAEPRAIVRNISMQELLQNLEQNWSQLKPYPAMSPR